MLSVMLLIILIASGVVSANESPRLAISGVHAEQLVQAATLSSLQDSFTAIAESAEPGVVSITAYQGNPPSASSGGNRAGVEYMPLAASDAPAKASGSGVIVRRDGARFYILTNYHLVERAYAMDIHTYDHSSIKGTVIGIDPVTDLAVVQVSSPTLSDANILRLGDSSSVKVGAWALAVGSPYGFDYTLTVGVVSALHRTLDEEDAAYPDLIQTDAAINKGNSGGPLLDMSGSVIGINAAIASPTGSFIGLGFAIPINAAKVVMDDLIKDGRVVRGWIGANVQDTNPVLREYYGVLSGVLVVSVDSQGPAARAGMQSEDVLVEMDGAPVTDSAQFQQMVADITPGDNLPVVVIRGGKRYSLQIRSGVSPLTPSGRPIATSPASGKGGVNVRSMTPDLAREIGLKSAEGVIVLDVWPGSSADEAGLYEGDVIIKFNGRRVANADNFNSMLNSSQSGDIVVLQVFRKGEQRIIGFKNT